MRKSMLWVVAMVLSACGPSSLEQDSETGTPQEDASVVRSGLNSPSGYHDRNDSTTVYGWACDPDNYSQPLTIHFYKENGVLVGSTTANLTREVGVAYACGGFANHGFAWTVPNSLKDGYQHYIYAYAIDLNGGQNPLLGNSPQLYGPVGTPVGTSSCGTACQSGWHPIAYSCQTACGGTCFYSPPNALSCAPNSAKFGQCGTTCPANWHASSVFCSSDCYPSACTNSPANAAYCEYNQGSFSQCGGLCPTGWRAASYSCSTACGACPPGTSNTVNCVPY